MELPSQAQGDPYVAFDSTGLVFGVTAAMAAGQGNVSNCYSVIAKQIQLCLTRSALRYGLSTFISMTPETMLAVPLLK